jgi:16S rRNA (guanine966-N2)-methyltransferase
MAWRLWVKAGFRLKRLDGDMRIISGRFRGRRLSGPKALEIRPTSDRLKESLFNILGRDTEGSLWLDVFAGSGSIGLEAISRGACQVDFLERDPEACRLIRRNLELCGIQSGYRLIQDDAFHGLRRLARLSQTYDFIFMDPPYAWEPYGDLVQIVFARRLARESAWVIIEHHAKAILPDAGEDYHRSRLVRQGEHALSIFRNNQAGVPGSDPVPNETGDM